MTDLALFESDHWHLDRSILARRLLEDWPGIEVRGADANQPESPIRDISWYYLVSDMELEGYSHPDGTCIYLEGPIGLVVKFVVWYRKLIPDDIDVIFCDEGYNFNHTVKSDTSQDDLIAAANR